MGLIVSVSTFLHEFYHSLEDPDNGSPINITKVIIVGSGVVFLITLFSPRGEIYDRVLEWPQFMTKRVYSTYFYYGCSVAVAWISMVLACQSNACVEFILSNRAESICTMNTAAFITACLAHSLPYTEEFGAKEIAMIFHSSVTGVILAPLFWCTWSVVLKSLWMTAIAVFELTVAGTLLSSDFIIQVLVAPVLIGYALVDFATLVSIIIPPHQGTGAHAHAVNLYIGTAVFAGFTLITTHLIFIMAEIIEADDLIVFDPINAGLVLFMGTTNLFLRITILLAKEGDSE